MIHNIDNTTFLQALFGPEWDQVHVNSFLVDPSAIANDRRGICWNTNHYGPWATAGGLPAGNQYFDIATFYPAEDGAIRRRKALYKRCHVFVLDDVSEKIPEDQAARLPAPSWILRTSAGSNQWGYILDPVLAGRFLDYTEAEVCNAQDILISSDLVPSGKDPGMRGVTRLVRLPEGHNSKASRLVDGWRPFNCEITLWKPENRTTLEAIIAPFALEGETLDMVRRETVTEGQQIVSDHPVLAVVDVLQDKGGGQYDVVCPNVGDHTDHDTSGTAIWTYPDGRAGIKCHHGSCLEFTGAGLMAWCREQEGWQAAREHFQAARAADAFRDVEAASGAGESGQDMAPVADTPEWVNQSEIFNNIVTITEGRGGFFNLESRAFIDNGGVINSNWAELVDGVLPATWLRTMPGKMTAQGVGWHPIGDKFIHLNGRKLVNSYREPHIIPIQNDDLIKNWLFLCEYIYGEHAKLVMDHMAFTLQHPDRKIRWQVLTVGKPRTGKTMSVEPLNLIMGDASSVVSKDNSGEAWGDVFAKSKVVIYEEIDHTIDFDVLKPRLANSGLEHLNIKGQGYLVQMNLYSMYLFSNKDDALQFDTDQDKLLVIRAPSEKLDEATFYKPLGQQMERSAEFLSAAYYHLLNRDVSDFQYHSLPERTEALYAMHKASRDQAEVAILSAIKHLDGPFSLGLAEQPAIKKWLRDNGYGRVQDKRLKEVMLSGGWVGCKGQKKIDGKNDTRRFWAPVAAVENLSSVELHRLFVEAMGNPFGV